MKIFKYKKRIVSAILAGLLIINSADIYAQPIYDIDDTIEDEEIIEEIIEEAEIVEESENTVESDSNNEEDSDIDVISEDYNTEELTMDDSNETDAGLLSENEKEIGEYKEGNITYTSYEIDIPDIDTSSPVEIPRERRRGLYTTKAANLPSSYDSRTKGLVTSVKNQGEYGTCWAHATAACIEASLIKNGAVINGIKSTADTIDISELEIAHDSYQICPNDALGNMLEAGEACVDFSNRGGTGMTAMDAFIRWDGIVLESDSPYSTLPLVVASNTAENHIPEDRYKIHIKDFYGVNSADTDKIKEEIMKNGSGFLSLQGTYFDNTKAIVNGKEKVYTVARYNDTTGRLPNHAVAVVGWDDDFPREYFISDRKTHPNNNGAFLCKNSYGSNWHTENGYFWLSYEDKVFVNLSGGVFFFNANIDDNTESYKYSGMYGWNGISNGLSTMYYSATYKNNTDDIFTLNSTAIEMSDKNNGYSVNVDIYKDSKAKGNIIIPNSGYKVASVSDSYDRAGFHVLNLGKQIPIYPGEVFSIIYKVMGSSDLYMNYTEYWCDKWNTDPYCWTSCSTDGENWKILGNNDKYNANMPIFAFGTRAECKDISSATVTVDDVEQLNAKYYYENEKKPNIAVKLDGTTLEAGKDYEITEITNDNVFTVGSSHTVKIKGKGEYKGVATGSYNIIKNDLTDAEITLNSAINPTTTIEQLKTKLIVNWVGEEKVKLTDSDYTLVSPTVLSGLKKGDEIRITVSGKNDCAGSVTKAQTVEAIVLTSQNTSVKPKQIFNPFRTEQYPESVIFTGEDGIKKELIHGTDFTVEYNNGASNTSGEKTVSIIGIGGYTTEIENDAVEKTYTVEPYTFSNEEVGFYIKGIKVNEVIYTPNTKPLEIKVEKNGETVLDENYSIKYSNTGYDEATGNIQAGEVTATITGDGVNVIGTLQNSYTVNKASIVSASLSGITGSTDYYYGKPVLKPAAVKVNGYTLTTDDYDLTYEGDKLYRNTNNELCSEVGAVRIVINGKGNYEGKRVRSYSVEPISLAETELTLPTSTSIRLKNKNKMLLVPIVTYDSHPLNPETDYEITYSKNVNDIVQGDKITVTVTAKDDGNCIESNSKEYLITGIDLKDADVNFEKVVYRPNLASEPPIVSFDDTRLEFGQDYEVRYAGDWSKVTEAGVDVTILAKKSSLYNGSTTAHYDVLPYSFTGYEDIKYDEELTFDPTITREFQKPQSVKVAFDNGTVTLEEGTDYVVTHSGDANEVGTVTMAVSGKGNYIGRVEKTYEIKKADLENANVSFNSTETYKPNLELQNVTVKYQFTNEEIELSESDYEVIYKDEDGNVLTGTDKLEIGTIKATIKAKESSNYTGSKTIEYRIVPEDIANVSYESLSNEVYSKGMEYRNQQLNHNGSGLEKDKDYRVIVSKDYTAATDVVAYKVNFAYTGIGNYTGTHTESYLVNKADKAPGAPSNILTGLKKGKEVSAVEIEGDWRWTNTDKNKKLSETAGNSITAKAEYTGEDANCYVTTISDVTVTTTACDHPESNTEFVVDIPATCLDAGYGHTQCHKCDFSIQDNITIDATGHSFTNYATNGDATCTEDGTKTAKCDHCTETDTTTDTGSKLGHIKSERVVKEATASETGLKEIYCTRCDKIFERIVLEKLATTIDITLPDGKKGDVKATVIFDVKDAAGNKLEYIDLDSYITVGPKKVTFANAKKMPTIVGYTFKGWYTTGTNGKPKKVSSLTAKNLKDMTISATYTENQYQIQYKVVKPKDGKRTAKIIGKVKNQSKIKYNDEVTLASGLSATIAANAKKDLPEVNYQLVGWTTQKNGTTVEYTPNEVVKQLKGQTKKDKKIVLYSVWKVKLG